LLPLLRRRLMGAGLALPCIASPLAVFMSADFSAEADACAIFAASRCCFTSF
jgi:hypothetical protein